MILGRSSRRGRWSALPLQHEWYADVFLDFIDSSRGIGRSSLCHDRVIASGFTAAPYLIPSTLPLPSTSHPVRAAMASRKLADPNGRPIVSAARSNAVCARSSSSAAPWRLSPKPPLVRRILGPQKARIDAVELLSDLLQSRRRPGNHLIGRLDAAFGRAVDDFARLDRGSALRKRGLDSR
jgi:hypothetical protein